MVYEVKDEAVTKMEPTGKSPTVITPSGGSSGINISPFFGVLVMMWLFFLLRFRRQRW